MQDSCRHNHLTEAQDALGEPQSNTDASVKVNRAYPATPAKGCQLRVTTLCYGIKAMGGSFVIST